MAVRKRVPVFLAMLCFAWLVQAWGHKTRTLSTNMLIEAGAGVMELGRLNTTEAVGGVMELGRVNTTGPKICGGVYLGSVEPSPCKLKDAFETIANHYKAKGQGSITYHVISMPLGPTMWFIGAVEENIVAADHAPIFNPTIGALRTEYNAFMTTGGPDKEQELFKQHTFDPAKNAEVSSTYKERLGAKQLQIVLSALLRIRPTFLWLGGKANMLNRKNMPPEMLKLLAANPDAKLAGAVFHSASQSAENSDLHKAFKNVADRYKDARKTGSVIYEVISVPLAHGLHFIGAVEGKLPREHMDEVFNERVEPNTDGDKGPKATWPLKEGSLGQVLNYHPNCRLAPDDPDTVRFIEASEEKISSTDVEGAESKMDPYQSQCLILSNVLKKKKREVFVWLGAMADSLLELPRKSLLAESKASPATPAANAA